jgi:hypothetical protein
MDSLYPTSMNATNIAMVRLFVYAGSVDDDEEEDSIFMLLSAQTLQLRKARS